MQRRPSTSNLSSVTDVYRQRNRDRMKRIYGNLNATQKQEYIDKVKKHKKSQSSQVAFLFKDQIQCESEGPILYQPVCSEIHELQNMPNCIYCDAVRFEHEPPTFCCDNGKIKLAPIEVSDELYELFTSQSEEAIQFRSNIRPFNCIFSFTSFGAKLDKELASARRGIYTFRAQGMVYHGLPGLIPKDDGPGHFQLYFVETENEVENRMNIFENSTLCEVTINKLIKVLEVNPYANFFKRLKDYPSMDDVKLHISKNVKLDQRVYNSPTVDQVAAIWVEGNNVDKPFEHGIVVHAHSGDRHRIKHYYGCYDPLQYPLLFSRGETGWHQNIKKIVAKKSALHIEVVDRESNKKVSCREYSCYRLQIRNPRQSTILFAGRLLQQYVVDMYIKLETTRLDYYRQNQSNMRAELYQGIMDCVLKGETRGSEVGRRIVLPASFIGGPRDMRRRYLDALALVQKFGKPDLFITMTCNP